VQHTVTEWTSPPLRTSVQQPHGAMFRSARILQRMRGTAGAHKATTTAIGLSKRVVTRVNAVGTRRSLASSVGAGEVDASKCVPLVSKTPPSGHLSVVQATTVQRTAPHSCARCRHRPCSVCVCPFVASGHSRAPRRPTASRNTNPCARSGMPRVRSGHVLASVGCRKK
jgi:hypothetical protein